MRTRVKILQHNRLDANSFFSVKLWKETKKNCKNISESTIKILGTQVFYGRTETGSTGTCFRRNSLCIYDVYCICRRSLPVRWRRGYVNWRHLPPPMLRYKGCYQLLVQQFNLWVHSLTLTCPEQLWLRFLSPNLPLHRSGKTGVPA